MSEEKVKGKSVTKKTLMSRLSGKPDPEDPAANEPVIEEKASSLLDDMSNSLDAILKGNFNNADDGVADGTAIDPKEDSEPDAVSNPFDMDDLFPPDEMPPEPDLDETEPPDPDAPDNSRNHPDDYILNKPALTESIDPEEVLREIELASKPLVKNPDDDNEPAAKSSEPTKKSEKPSGGGLRAISKAPILNDDAPDDAYEAYQAKILMDAEKARRIMNVLATLGPVFKRVVGNADSDDAAGLVSDLLKRSEELQERLYPIFNARSEREVPKWLQAQLARYCTSMVAENPSLSVDDIVAMSSELSRFSSDIRYEYSKSLDDKTQVKLSLIKAISRIESEINEFHSKLMEANVLDLAEKIESNRESILNEISGFIVDKVGDGMSKLNEPSASRKTKTMMIQSLIGQASEFYLSSISYELSLYWQRRGQNQKKGTLEKFADNFISRNKLGFNADGVKDTAGKSFDDLIAATNKEFDKQFDRLISFTCDKIQGSIKNV